MGFKSIICFFVFFNFSSFSKAVCNNTLVTKKVFFDISINDDYWGRIMIGLFGETTPITSLNFATFASNHKNIGYAGTTIHRVYSKMAIQGGDLLNYNGTGSYSIFNGGEDFPDENFIFKNLMGWVGMVNRGPDTNGCQFFINIVNNPGLDGTYVAFAKVLTGFDVVTKIASLQLDSSGSPIAKVKIIGSGAFNPLAPYHVSYDMPYYY